MFDPLRPTTRDFTSGPIVGPLIRFSVPILAALFLQALYGAVDLLVVGKYAATADVSGVAVGSQIMMTVTGLISSLAMGSTILLGQKLGMREEKDCGIVIGVSIAFFGLVGLVLTLLLPAFSAVLARLMNAPRRLSGIQRIILPSAAAEVLPSLPTMCLAACCAAWAIPGRRS